MEYTNSSQPILVSTCNNPNVKVLLTINKISEYVDLNQFKSYVEYELIDIIDTLFVQALKTTPYDIQYYISGGKALNTIIKNKFLPKSFDYDIHVNTRDDQNRIQMHINNTINTELRKSYRKYPRYCIFKSLQKLGLVDDSLLNYYLNEDLFYFGTRTRDNSYEPDVGIKGVFIKLKFLKQVRRNSVLMYNNLPYNFTNYRNQHDLNKFIADLKKNGTSHDINKIISTMYLKMNFWNNMSEYNIYYHPISDIDIEHDINFGVKLYTPYVNPIGFIFISNNIKYASYILLLYNLIRYIKISQYKYKNNYKKLKLLAINPTKIKCDFYLRYQRANLEKDIRHFLPQMLVADRTLPTFANQPGNVLLIQVLNYINDNPIRIKLMPNRKIKLYGDNPDIITTNQIIKKLVINYIGNNTVPNVTCINSVLGPGCEPHNHSSFFVDATDAEIAIRIMTLSRITVI
jgi:hypothetical protein